MAKQPIPKGRADTRTIAVPVTLVVEGKQLPPGTPVELPADEADGLVARFGSVPVPDDAADPADGDTV